MINPPPRDGCCEQCGKPPINGQTKKYYPMAAALSDEAAALFREEHGDEAADVRDQMEHTVDHQWACETCLPEPSIDLSPDTSVQGGGTHR
mgnify:CR=1 FL=1